MSQKVTLVDIKKLKKSSELVKEEAENILEQARNCLNAQAVFFRKAGLEPEQLAELLKRYQPSEEVKQAMKQWETDFRNEQAQVAASKKKEMKLAGKLLMARKNRKKTPGSKKRCTKIF